MDRAADSGSAGCWFNSSQPRSGIGESSNRWGAGKALPRAFGVTVCQRQTPEGQSLYGERSDVAGSTPFSRAGVNMVAIGIDIIEPERIKRAAERSKKFLQRIFTEDEMAYCEKKKNKFQHYAARFAAKEAVKKALSPSIPWRDIEVVRQRGQKPVIRLHGKYAVNYARSDVILSLTHIKSLSVAVVIVATKT